MSAVVEQLLQVQPETAGAAGAAAPAPFAATSAIVATATQAGKLVQVDALAAGKSLDDARLSGHAVTVSHLVLAIDDLVQTQGSLVTALEATTDALALALKQLAAVGYDGLSASSDEIVAAASAALARVNGRAD